MCGIAGIVRTSGLSLADREKFPLLTSALRHRGPDGEGTYSDDICGLVQTRLAIVDNAEHQLPFSISGRYQIVFNGEIYNHRDLRKELQSTYEFSTDCDTEVCLASWLEWGPKCLDRFEGMFALFVWDKVDRVGFAARDELGVKPLFYTSAPGFFAFASEPQALIRSGVARFKLDEVGVGELLTAPYFSGAVRTPFSGIQPMQPGTCVRFQDAKLETVVDNRFSFESSAKSGDLESALLASSNYVAESDESIGMFLSGGVDSSLIASMIVRETGRKLPCWTIAFPDDLESDYEHSLIVRSVDLPYAKAVASHADLPLSVISVTTSEYKEALMRVLELNDLGAAWEQEISQYILCRSAAENVRVVIVGDAADETHFGYPFQLREHVTRSPLGLIEFFGSVPLRKEIFGNSTAFYTELYKRHAEDRGCRWATSRDATIATATLVVDLWLGRLLYNGDRYTMIHSMEGRVPFACQAVTKLASSVMFEETIASGLEKSHLRRIAEKYLPDTVAWRPKSALTKSMRGQTLIFSEFRERWTKSADALLPLVDENFVRDFIERTRHAHDDRDASIAFRLLSALALIDTFQRYS